MMDFLKRRLRSHIEAQLRAELALAHAELQRWKPAGEAQATAGRCVACRRPVEHRIARDAARAAVTAVIEQTSGVYGPNYTANALAWRCVNAALLAAGIERL